MVSIERELMASYRLVLEFAGQGDAEAVATYDQVRRILMAPMPTRTQTNPFYPLSLNDEMPHTDIPWTAERTEGKGGRRSTQEYRELAATYGFDLPDPMGWMQARDAGRSLEVAQAKVDSEHINIHTEGLWIEDLQ